MVKIKKLPLDSMVVSSKFGPRNITVDGKTYWWHNGIDLVVEIGKPIYAVSEGIIKVATNNNGSYGLYLTVDHGQFSTLYAHLSSCTVSVGQKVNAGDILGYTGQTGAVTGPHLHFEMRICEYDNFWDRCACDSSVFMRGVDPQFYFNDYEERTSDITMNSAIDIVKNSVGLEDKTIDYLMNDYKYGEALITKLAKALK
jgi:murein DD-endopeptidase MepM/ murein hydrolase activator NlpD